MCLTWDMWHVFDFVYDMLAYIIHVVMCWTCGHVLRYVGMCLIDVF